MSRSTLWIGRIMVVVVALAMCGAPQFAQAMAEPQDAGQTAPEAQSTDPAAQSPTGNPNSAAPDPTKGPLEPVPSTTDDQLPEAPSATQPQAAQSQPAAPAQQRRPEAPLGAAAAQAGPTAGGAASKPAGTAIAPPKQRQVRSFLIKLGAVAAAGAAVGAVYMLSRGTPSLPPNSGR